MVNSRWRYKTYEYSQTIVLPMNSSTFELKFELHAALDDEIFFKFERPSQEPNWFYTFNSADIRLRKPFPDTIDVSGENYYPVVGGVFINNSQEFLQVFPKFPLGAGMPNDHSFELHMHRNPNNDDFLGLGAGLKDPKAAHHDFLIRIDELNTSTIWKDYLSHKNSLIMFAVGDKEEEISLNLKDNYDRFEEWNSTTEYSLTDENECVYLSSLGVSNEKMYARVLNICETPKKFSLNSTEIVDQVLVNEKHLEGKILGIQIRGEINLEVNSNSGRDVIRYPIEYKDGLVSQFTFTGYEINHTCALYHHIATKEINVSYSEMTNVQSNYVDPLTLIMYSVFLTISTIALILILMVIIRKKRVTVS